ncbi:hypothetical protein M595_2382 [Lyngbya aestuarii BL J]|uniref:Uncharacterized protein n=1 Tax=Lyngbya aestuarii BL J TaxID=1348334 RepID=U7QI89_9CYAN|nr:hypothetical protein M595_2382 [Lyngbya aestuarii BL J]
MFRYTQHDSYYSVSQADEVRFGDQSPPFEAGGFRGIVRISPDQ